MQKSIFITLLSVAAFTMTTGIASAAATPGVAKHQILQMKRIHQGIHNGTLKPREAITLLRGEVKIQRQKRRIRADGVVTPRERLRLHRALNKQNARIRRKKRN